VKMRQDDVISVNTCKLVLEGGFHTHYGWCTCSDEDNYLMKMAHD